MREYKKKIHIKHHLDSQEELIQHIIKSSQNEINLDECEINFVFDLRSILLQLKDEDQMTGAIDIQFDVNEFNDNIFYCFLKIPLRCEAAIFSHEAYFELIYFEKYVQFTGATFLEEYSFKKSTFYESVFFDFADFNKKDFFVVDKSFYKTIFRKKVSFFSSSFLGLANFSHAEFYDIINIRDSEFRNIDFAHIETKANFDLEDFHSATINKVNNRLTGLFLKKLALSKNDSILSIHFQKLEMEAYRKSLRLTDNFNELSAMKKIRTFVKMCCDRFLLYMNKLSNNYGTSWFHGVCYTITVWFVFFSWFAMAKYGIGGSFIWTNEYYLKYAIDYFWLFNGIDGLSELRTSWGEIIPFILGKIFIGYGIYQTIAAFRKYGR